MLILLRHATPIIDYGFCNHKIASERMLSYNSTHQIKTTEIDDYIDEIQKKASENNPIIIYSSDLPRSKITADYIFKNIIVEIKSDPIFSEFDLNILKIPLIKLQTKTWFLVSRIAWFLGVNINAAPFHAEKNRAKKAAEMLENHLTQGKTVILVGHGLMNKFIENHFKKIGWNIQRGAKNGCFEIKTIKKN